MKTLAFLPLLEQDPMCLRKFFFRALGHRNLLAVLPQLTQSTQLTQLTHLSLLTLSTLLALNAPVSCFAQGTTFTYQGRLNDTGNPATGIYDLRFTVYDAATNGNVVVGPATISATAISNGLFTVTLDFGVGVFTGPARFLDIGVRTNEAGAFAILSPRQQLTPAPYAITAENLNGILSATDLSGAYPSQITLSNPSNQLSGNFSATAPGTGFFGNGAGLSNVNANAIGGVPASGFWQTAGNAGTIAGPNFVGTTDNQPLELHVNGVRGLRIEPSPWPNLIGGSPTDIVIGSTGVVIAGGDNNNVQTNAAMSVIAGGQGSSIQAGAANSVIGGGSANIIQANAFLSVIAGGAQNIVQAGAQGATIGGGYSNAIGANSVDSSIAGGIENSIGAGATSATIGGGASNFIGTNTVEATITGGTRNAVQDSAFYSTIAGGNVNTIQTNAEISFIGGGGGNIIGVSAIGSVIAGGSDNAIQATSTNSTVVGGYYNNVGINASFATVSGGTFNSLQSAYATVAGGFSNQVGSSSAFALIGGGASNKIQASAPGSVIAGGQNCTIQTGSTNCAIGGGNANNVGTNGFANTIAGGDFNTIQSNATTSFIGGGLNNTVSGSLAVVPGGFDNFASGDYSFAAGSHAVANGPGCFVWADSSSSAFFHSTANNQFLVRAAGGVGLGTTNTPDLGLSLGFNTHLNDNPLYLRPTQDHNHGIAYCGPGTTNFAPGVLPDGPVIWGYSGGALGAITPHAGPAAGYAVLTWGPAGITVNGQVCAANVSCTSDRNAKENIEAVSPSDVLARVAALPISRWNFRQDTSSKHIGPMAQDFYAAFKVGSDDKHIGMTDESGVALAAIQGLNQKLNEKDAEIENLKARLEKLETLVRDHETADH